MHRGSRPSRRNPPVRRSTSKIHPPPPNKEPAPLNLVVVKGFTAWKEQHGYKLDNVPFVASHPDSDKVHYKITYCPDATSQSLAEAECSVEPKAFMKDLGNDKIRLQNGDLIAISSIDTLHIQMPPAVVPALENRVFSSLTKLTYVGDLRRLQEINWSACFPQMEGLQVQGEVACSVFREILQGSAKLERLTVNLLVEDSDIHNGNRDLPPRIEHPKMKNLVIVSYTSVDRALSNLTLGALEDIRLWMMPNVAMNMGLHPMPLHIQTNGVLTLNFDAGDIEGFHNTVGMNIAYM